MKRQHAREKTTLTRLRGLTLATLAVTAASLLGAGAAYAEEKAGHETGPAASGADVASCTSIVITADGSPKPGTTTDGRPQVEPYFHVMKIVDLEVWLVLPTGGKTTSTGQFNVRFQTPRGALYEERDVPYADVKGAAAEKERRLREYPFPVPVQPVTTDPKTLQTSVKVKLPVGGTNIVGSGLYGSWGVTAERAGLPPCSGSFTLLP